MLKFLYNMIIFNFMKTLWNLKELELWIRNIFCIMKNWYVPTKWFINVSMGKNKHWPNEGNVLVAWMEVQYLAKMKLFNFKMIIIFVGFLIEELNNRAISRQRSSLKHFRFFYLLMCNTYVSSVNGFVCMLQMKYGL